MAIKHDTKVLDRVDNGTDALTTVTESEKDRERAFYPRSPLDELVSKEVLSWTVIPGSGEGEGKGKEAITVLIVNIQSIPGSGVLRTQKLKTHLLRTQSSNVLPLKP